MVVDDSALASVKCQKSGTTAKCERSRPDLNQTSGTNGPSPPLQPSRSWWT